MSLIKRLAPQNKTHKLFLVSAANVAIRAMGIVGSVAAVYVLSRTLDTSQFGMWAWLLSVATLITSQDFGVISAMRIELSKLGVGQDVNSSHLQNQLVFSVLQGLLAIIGIGLLALLFLSIGVEGLTAIKAPYGLFALVVMISLLSLLGTISANALLAFLKEDQVALLDFCRNTLQLFAVALIYILQADLNLATAIFFAPYALYSLVGLYLLLQSRQLAMGAFVAGVFSNIQQHWIEFLSIFKAGLPLWAIQLGAIAFSGSELIYVGFFADDATIGTTAILQRYVNIAIAFTAASTVPFLGHYAKRIQQNSDEDRNWLKHKSNIKLLGVLAIGLIYSLFLILFGEQITELWSGQIVQDKYLYLLIGAVFTVTAMNTLFQLFYQSNKVYVPVIWALGICGAIKLLGISFLYPPLQMTGIWISFLVGNFIFLLFNFFYVRAKLLAPSH